MGEKKKKKEAKTRNPAQLNWCTCMFNSILAIDNFCHLLLTFAKQFDPRFGIFGSILFAIYAT